MNGLKTKRCVLMLAAVASALACGSAFSEAGTFSAADIVGLDAVSGIDAFEAALKDLDPIREATRFEVSDRKPELVRKDGDAVIIRYFYELRYDMEAYSQKLLPHIDRILSGTGKCAMTRLSVKMEKDDFTVKYANLSQKGTFFADLHEITRLNPDAMARCYYIANRSVFEPPEFPFGDYDPRTKLYRVDRVDVVESVTRSGMLNIRRYALSKEQADVFVKWRSAYVDSLAKRHFAVRLLDKDGGPVVEEEFDVRYPRLANADGLYSLLACGNPSDLSQAVLTKYGPFQIVFSPFLGLQIKNALSPIVGLSECLPCFADIREKPEELKSIVKFEIGWK